MICDQQLIGWLTLQHSDSSVTAAFTADEDRDDDVNDDNDYDNGDNKVSMQSAGKHQAVTII